MDISLAWLNEYLRPAGVTADEADELLTQAGFPIEGRTDLPGGDVLLDVEVTSNRMDCLSHVGCAREVAALSSRELVLPAAADVRTDGDIASVLTLENRDHANCPLFTARVIRGAKIGPSPAWLVERLEAIGQRPINNAVDATNFVTHELGNPSHVFDLKKLAGGALVIRRANSGETLETLDGKTHTLRPEDVVVADAERATSLAGVMGGAASEVDEGTTDIVLEVATWAPVLVRTTGRRLNIATDAGYRFQRGVDARTVAYASRRLVAMIAELTGGTVMGGGVDDGALVAGAALAEARRVTVRPSRVRTLLGIDAAAPRVASVLSGFGLGAEQTGDDEVTAVIPPHRERDLLREVDLIEEYARGIGYHEIPASPAVSVSVRAPQAAPKAVAELGRVLTGLGFNETVTFSFTSPAAAADVLPAGLRTVAVSDDRRKEEPTLRPSSLTGLLACRAQNQSARSAAPGAVRLFEVAAVFGETGGGVSGERRTATLLMDVPGSGETGKRSVDEVQTGLRVMRGAIDAVVRAMAGPEAAVVVEPFGDGPPAVCWDGSASGRVSLAGDEPVELGVMGLISKAAAGRHDLEVPVVGAELDLERLIAPFPPASLARALPSFPAIERDVSLVMDEAVRWSAVEGLVSGLGLERQEALAYVGAYRGKQVGQGKKSVTLRLRFRDAGRTLRREEVEPEVERLVAAARSELGAEVRG